jgi:hypothetical protein
MKAIIFNFIKGWILQQALERVIEPLRQRAKQTTSKWDDELVNELSDIIADWLK